MALLMISPQSFFFHFNSDQSELTNRVGIGGGGGIGFFLAVIFRLVKIRFAVTVSNLPVFKFAVIFISLKATRFFI